MTQEDMQIEFIKMQGEIVELKGMVMRQCATIMEVNDKYYEIKKMLKKIENGMKNDNDI